MRKSQDLFSEVDLNADNDQELDGTNESSMTTIEVADFESCELDHYTSFIGWQRASCFVHTLQLVVKVFETNRCFQPTLQKASSKSEQIL